MTMTMTTTAPIHKMKPETIMALQELTRALHDSSHCLNEAADSIDEDSPLSTQLRTISVERTKISNDLVAFITINDFAPVGDGTFLGGLRAIWTKLRAGLNGGRPDVVLIEVARAEASILDKFKQVLTDVADSPIADRLMSHYETVKRGHDDILLLRKAALAS